MDLGKRMRFELKQNRQPFETQPLLDAPTVVSMLMDRTNPEHPEFDERVAGPFRRSNSNRPTEFIITFERVPLGSKPSSRASSLPTIWRKPPAETGFRIAESDADHTVFRVPARNPRTAAVPPG